MDWENLETITWRGKKYKPVKKLFQRQIGDGVVDEYHVVLIVQGVQDQHFALKVIQEIKHDDDYWDEDTQYEWDAGITGVAKMELSTALRLLTDGWQMTCKGEYDQRRQTRNEEFPGYSIHLLKFPLLPPANITPLDTKQLEHGFGLGTDLMKAKEPTDAYPHAQALHSTLKSLWDLGYDFRGSYEWFGYDESSKQCYLFDYTGIFLNHKSTEPGAQFSLTLALLNCDIPWSGFA